MLLFGILVVFQDHVGCRGSRVHGEGVRRHWRTCRWPLTAVTVFWLLCVQVLGLLLVVVRALLRQATTLRADMEAVI